MSSEILSRHHEDLDRRISVLLMKADSGDNHELAGEWNRFERELLRHFELEEREVFPRFSREHFEDAAALKQEHEALRRDLLALGIRADLHFLRAEAVRAFVADLRAHAAREEELLYPWSDTNVDLATWTAIARGLRDAGQSLASGLDDLGPNAL